MNRKLLSILLLFLPVWYELNIGFCAEIVDEFQCPSEESNHIENNQSSNELTLISKTDDLLCFATNPLFSSGIAVIGYGKGGNFQQESVTETRGFVYCKLGTGVDIEGNITGERYVFGPGLGVYFGAHYTYLYSGRWCGAGAYRPDGSIYDEDKYGVYIPHPADYDYDYWIWYNVYFYWNPMPADMSSVEGNWTVRWFDNGAVVCTKIATCMYTISDHKMCKAISSGNPVTITTSFRTTDARCYSWLYLKNYALNWNKDIKWMWYSPEGYYTEEEYDISDPGSGAWYDWIKCWAGLYIAGQYPAYHPGKWHVDIYIKDYTGTYEHKLTENFTITGPTPIASPTPTPTPTPSPTPTPVVHFTFATGNEGWQTSGSIAQYDIALTSQSNGHLGLSPDGSTNSFFYWYSPDISIEDGSVYHAEWLMGASVTNPDAAVHFRLRINQQGSWQGWSRLVNSYHHQSPTLTPKWYDIIFSPEVTGSADSKIDASFDIMSFVSSNDINSWIYLEELIINKTEITTDIPIIHYEFATGTDGWQFSGYVSPFDMAHTSADHDRLGLNAWGSTNCFSYWNSPYIQVENGHIYQAIFQVRSSVSNPDDAVQLRFRVNQKDSWQAWERIVNSECGQGPYRTTSKFYDIYFIPRLVGGEDYLTILSFDLLCFSPLDDCSSWSYLESATVNDVTLAH